MVWSTQEHTFSPEGETDIEFIKRLCETKDSSGLTWNEIASIVESKCGIHHTESWYRKNYQKGAFNVDQPEEIEDGELSKLIKEKVELRDLVTANNAMLRRMSREQTIKDIAHDFAKQMSLKPLLDVVPQHSQSSNKQGVLLISDWHYGLTCDNWWNKFDVEICKKRVSTLLLKVIEAIKFHNLEKLTVLDLSDLIAGRIHTQIRIESRFDVITQTMEVSEILAEFLSELSKHCVIDFYSCLDNHSRLEPNKKEAMDLESLSRIIPWYLTERLSTNTNVCLCNNEYGEDIITCNVLGHSIIAVHGHDDKPETALEKLSMFTKKQYDMICMAHRHHMFFEERSESMVVSNGCLVGVDVHSKKLRLSSKPSQTLIIVTPDNVTDDIKRILV